MTALLRAYLALFVLVAVLVASSIGAPAAEFRSGAMVQVKPNSIWFENAALLTKWQQLKKSGDKAALESFQEQKLRQRDAWQFIYQQTVKVLGHEPKQHRVHVEMQGPGRMEGTKWFLDPDVFVPGRAAKP